MPREVLYGKDARAKILIGVKKIAKAVATTLGPSGRTTIISRSEITSYGLHHAPLHLSKDGVTVCRVFALEDQLENVGVRIIREAAEKTVLVAGDSTTTTVVLAESMIEKGMMVLDSGHYNAMQLKKGMDAAAQEVIAELKRISTPIAGSIDRIRQVATVSANNDAEIGGLIAEAYGRIGNDGVINLEEAKGVTTTMKVTDGFKFDRGYLSPHFINRKEKGLCELEAPFILLYDKNVSQIKQLEAVVLATREQNRPLLIICEDADSEALAWLCINNEKKAISVCVVKCPFHGDAKDAAMFDLAALTGGAYLSTLNGVKLEKATLQHLGQAEKVVVTKDQTVIIGGAKDEVRKNKTLQELYALKADSSDEDEKERIAQRIARLNGAVAVISVGAPTETEMLEKKDRLDDAIRSVRCAIYDGYVVGGGTAFVRCQVAVDARQSVDFQRGQEIVYASLEVPLLQICANAGVNGSDILVQVLALQGNMGYNAQTELIEDLEASGIIDATKVLCAAITNATSVAGTLLTSEALICDTY